MFPQEHEKKDDEDSLQQRRHIYAQLLEKHGRLNADLEEEAEPSVAAAAAAAAAAHHCIEQYGFVKKLFGDAMRLPTSTMEEEAVTTSFVKIAAIRKDNLPCKGTVDRWLISCDHSSFQAGYFLCVCT